MDRRTFLSRAVVSGVAAISPTWQTAQAASALPSILLIDGVTPGTSASGLFSFLDPIISQNVPVGIAVKYDHEEWQKHPADPGLFRLLSMLSADYSGLVDLVIDLPDIAVLHPYLRMRAASQARNRFRQALLAAAGDKSLAAVPQTVLSRLPASETPVIEGLRSTGILTSFLLPKDGAPPEIWRNSDGTQQINGGWRLPPSPTSQEIGAILSKGSSGEEPAVFAAKFPGDVLHDEQEFFNQGAALGDAFRQNLTAGRNYSSLPSDLRFRSGDVFSRHLVLCIQAGDTEASSGTLGAKLTAVGISFTMIENSLPNARPLSGASAEKTGEHAVRKCFQVSETDDDNWQRARDIAFGGITPDAQHRPVGLASCAAKDESTDTATNEGEHAGFEIVLNLSKGAQTFSGFDDFGALRLNTSLVLDQPHSGPSVQPLRERIKGAALPSEDVVLLVKEKGFFEPDHVNTLVEELVGLEKSDQFDVLDMDQYLAAVSVKSEQARLLRAAQRRPARLHTDEINPAERDQLMDDAKLAWSYIEQLTDPNTGLVPATAWLQDDKVYSYEFCTMWDTGSLVLAILSAHSIGLLSDAEFYERIEAVLGGLATGTFNGLRLPKGLTSTNGKAYGDDKYNASDSSRLLISLHLLEKHAQKDLGISGILDAWDINKTIRDGIPLTAHGNQLVSAYRSNYAGYTARAFGLWGYPVASPFSSPKPGSQFDRSVHILHDVAEFGPIGTEPHLLEAVELGASDLASATSEALFAAQVEEYLSTGKLVCVSEGPVNREPWFVYQGFQIGTDQDRWTVETLDPSPRFQTKGFIRAVDTLNSKAAFLWDAYRPGQYNDLLIAHVREKAKGSSLGFSPGVFSVTAKSDQAYSDINTNGVILQAIAYRLNGRKPCLDWKSKG